MLLCRYTTRHNAVPHINCFVLMGKDQGNLRDYIDIIDDGEHVVLRPMQGVTLAHAAVFLRVLDTDFVPPTTTLLEADIAGVSEYDSFLVVWLAELQRYAASRNIPCEVRGASDEVERFVAMMNKPLHTEKQVDIEVLSPVAQYVEGVGERAWTFLRDAQEGFSFVGEVTVAVLSSRRRSGAIRWKDFPFHFSRGGVNAFPIVALITFLIGVITGYQGAVQLHKFGADIFLADLVTISLTRELAPLMTAIIVAGRSGSAYAAEIGTMKVGEEIDALQSMGFNITTFLVVPRVYATMFAMPVLTIFADLMGILGGIVAASFILDISLVRFLNQAQQALQYWDMGTGLLKSVVFGAVIGMVGCFRGLQVRGGAESVGRYTTQAVVTSIFLIILLDAIFTVVFQIVGI